jgi:hypothetical protein
MASSKKSPKILCALKKPNKTMEQQRPRKRGLTYGRLLIVMGAAIALALIVAFVQTLFLSNQLGFDEITFAMLRAATYDKAELTRRELDTRNGDTGKIQGTVIYIKTSEGHYAKLAVEFGYRFWSPKLQFVVYQGVVYDDRGNVLRKRKDELYNLYIPLNLRYDLDATLTNEEGASEAGVDLGFEERGPAEQILKALNGAAFYLPQASELRR